MFEVKILLLMGDLIGMFLRGEARFLDTMMGFDRTVVSVALEGIRCDKKVEVSAPCFSIFLCKPEGILAGCFMLLCSSRLGLMPCSTVDTIVWKTLS